MQVWNILGLRLGPQCSGDIMNCVCLYEARVARTSVVLCDDMHSCQLLANSDRDTVFSSSAIFSDFKSAYLRRLNLHLQTIVFDFAQILRVATFGLKMSRAKAFLSQPSESAIPACLSKMAEESPHIWPRKRMLPYCTGMDIQTKRHHSNIYSP